MHFGTDFGAITRFGNVTQTVFRATFNAVRFESVIRTQRRDTVAQLLRVTLACRRTTQRQRHTHSVGWTLFDTVEIKINGLEWWLNWFKKEKSKIKLEASRRCISQQRRTTTVPHDTPSTTRRTCQPDTPAIDPNIVQRRRIHPHSPDIWSTTMRVHRADTRLMCLYTCVYDRLSECWRERRVCNVVYRSALSHTPAEARHTVDDDRNTLFGHVLSRPLHAFHNDIKIRIIYFLKKKKTNFSEITVAGWGTTHDAEWRNIVDRTLGIATGTRFGNITLKRKKNWLKFKI